VVACIDGEVAGADQVFGQAGDAVGDLLVRRGLPGAADGRTFVLDEQRSIVEGSVTWVGQPTFYLLRLTASGTEESLTRIAVPAIPSGTVVSGLALSPNGSKLAVDVDSGSWPQARLMEIMTYTLATGAFRSWTTSGVTNADAPFGCRRPTPRSPTAPATRCPPITTPGWPPSRTC
jgi:hypothetical protein